METDEARGGSTPNVVRWVLGIGLLLAVVGLSLAWIIPSLTQDQSVMPSQNAQQNMMNNQAAKGTGTDSIVTPEQARPDQGGQASGASAPDEGAVPAVANSGQ